ncbi:tandem-95 repeat protein, partial [Vibrio crassostreae]|uniref:tandem-95 repeat protein n=1 Tax=Vibrio crassostreae TaxID=246167 RepID=UPI001BD36404
ASGTFDYQVLDDNGALSNTVTSRIDIFGTNDEPVVTANTVATINEDNAITVTEAELLANASDIDNATLSVVNVQLVGTDATLIDNGDDTWTITPNANFSGDVTITYDVSDGLTTTASQLDVTVEAVADAVVASLAESVATDFEEADGWVNPEVFGWSTDNADGIVERSPETTYGGVDATNNVVEMKKFAGEASNMYRVLDTQPGATYTFELDVSGRNNATAADSQIEILWEGVVIDTVGYENFGWNHHAYELVSTQTNSRIEFRAADQSGSGGLVDNINLTFTGFVGDEDTAIPIDISAELTDTDGSETLSTSITGLPVGAVVTDGVNVKTVAAANEVIDMNGWDNSNVSITPPTDFNGNVDIVVAATSTEASNGDTLTTNIPITLAVNAVNDAVETPVDVDIAASLVAEDLAIGSTVGITGLANDVDNTAAEVTYSLINENDTGAYTGPFTIATATGVVTVSQSLDRELAETHSFRIQADSTDGTNAISAVQTVTVTDVDEFDVSVATDIDATANIVDENATVGTTVGYTANATDADATTNTVTYRLMDSGPTTRLGSDGTIIANENGYTTYDGSASDINTVMYIGGDIPAGGVSSFTFEHLDGGRLIIDILSEDTVGAAGAANYKDLNGDGVQTNNMDLAIKVFDAAGNLVAQNDDGQAGADGSTSTWDPYSAWADSLTAGTYTVELREVAGDATPFLLSMTGNNSADLNPYEMAQSTADSRTTHVIDAATILANANDTDGDNIRIQSVENAQHGTVSINGNGDIEFVPNNDYAGPVSFTYTVVDPDGNTDQARITLNVTGTNTSGENATLDADPEFIDSGTTPVDIPVAPYTGPLAIDTNTGVITVDDTIDHETDATLDFVVESTSADGSVSYTTTQTITVNDLNDDGITVTANATQNVDEDNAITLTQSDLLANSTPDVAGTALTANNVILVGTDATLTDNGDSTYTVTPNANFNGNIDLNFDVTDGQFTESTSMNLAVNSVNDAVTTIGNIVAAVDEDNTITLTQAELLANASDIEGDALTATNVAVVGTDATVTDNLDGTFTLTPDANFNGAINLTYDISDGTTNTATGIDLTVNAINDAPDSPLNTYNATEDQTFVLNDADLLANATDVEGDVISVTNVTYAGTDATMVDTGTIQLGNDTNNRIELDTRLDGYDAFTFQMEYTSTGTHTGGIENIFGAPPTGAQNNHFNVFVNNATSGLEMNLFGANVVFANSPDLNDGNTHNITIAWDSASGTMTAFNNGVAFDTKTESQGSVMGAGGYAIIGQEQDSYGGTFDANQAATNSELGHVSMSYDRVSNADIQTGADLADISTDVAFDVRVVNDTVVDAGPDAMTLTTAGDVSHVREYEFKPDANFNGDISIDVEYSDGTDTNTVTHTVNFAPVNDGPVATDPTDTLINDNESITYTEAELLANASDIDGETLSVTNVAYAGTDGTLVDNGDDTWTFTPNNAFTGTADLVVTVSDGTATANFTQKVDVNIAVSANDDGRDDSGLIGIMTSNTGVFNGQTVTVSAHNEESAPYAAWKAVDGVDAHVLNNSNSWAGDLLAPSGTGAIIGWYQVDLGQTTTLYQYDLKSIVNQAVGRDPKAWTFEGSDDGVNWNVLDTRANEDNWGSAETRSYTLNQPESYRYFRFNITENNGDAVWVGFDGFQMYTMITVDESDVNHDFDVLANDVNLDGDPLTITSLTDVVDKNGNVVGTVQVVNIGGTDQVRFSPNGAIAQGATEAASFTYTVSDGRSESTETVNFFLTGQYDAISAGASVETNVIEGNNIIMTVDELTANIDNPEGTVLTLSNFLVTNGTFVDHGDDTFTFSPAANFNGIMEITYDVSDGTTTLNASSEVTVLNEVIGTLIGENLDGGFDADAIYGLAGDDILSGGEGDDTLTGGAGDDTLTGEIGADTFAFINGDEGTVGTHAVDTITDFEVGTDHIDISQFFDSQPNSTGGDMANVIDIQEDNGNTIFSLKSDGNNIDQEIIVENTTLNEFYGGDSSGISEADILQKMIDDNNLIS